jgi:hypothetical protein
VGILFCRVFRILQNRNRASNQKILTSWSAVCSLGKRLNVCARLINSDLRQFTDLAEEIVDYDGNVVASV